MSAATQYNISEFKSKSWTVRTSPTLSEFEVNGQEILKIFSQPVANQIQGVCRFERGFEQLLPLFSGLILLGNPSSLRLIFDRDRAQVFFTFSRSEEAKVVRFFNQVILLLKKEVQFKVILKKFIEKKKRFQSEQALLHAALHGKAWN
jgi:hypothetical protein